MRTVPMAMWTVAEAVARCPQAASVFTRFRMACVGCSMASFETLAEAAASYHLIPENLLGEFDRVCEVDIENPMNRKEADR